jgi:L-threonylcarbamoyladenylate synthase
MATIIFDTQKAKNLLAQGKIVAIPTETVYGLAACPTSKEIIQAIYDLKKRPIDKALAINVHPSWDIRQWGIEIPDYVFKLTHAFWPGPLSIILKANPKEVPAFLMGPEQTIALRCPKHPMTLEVLQQLGQILVAPSANPSHHLSPTHAKQVMDYFENEEITILDGGNCELGIESTILKANATDDYEILRLGAISLEKIQHCVGFAPRQITPPTHQGFLEKPMYFFKTSNEVLAYLAKHPQIKALCIARKKHLQNIPKALQYPLPESLQAIERTFYDILQKCQKTPSQVLWIESFEDHPSLHQIVQKYAKPMDMA